MKKKIIVSVSNDLSCDSRVNKVCSSLVASGYEVFLIGRKRKNALPLPQTTYRMRRYTCWFQKGVFFYMELNLRLFFSLLFSDADLFLSNDTDTLAANYLAAKICRKKLVFDAHELFPEVPELADRPKIKYIWTKIEDCFFPHLEHAYTVCQSIADYYKDKYNINMAVIRNVPAYHLVPETKRLSYNGKKIILYQGALNIGRGLEWTLNAMPFVDNAVFVIIGDGDIRKELEKQTSVLQIEDKVIFLGRIAADRLYEYTSSADIGLCLLENKGLSYYYALPNRIFDYLQAQVPVLATGFPEITRIVETYHTGRLIHTYEPTYLANIINEMLSNPIKTDHFEQAAKELCWEKEERILQSVYSALGME
jgi:glycosyltransferase involved in cell wall biosynthesis